jgi:hypothetical protein
MSAVARIKDAGRVVRFFRGLAEFRARPDDVFISSYPRSGTTWMQHVLHLMLSRGDKPFRHISEVAPWFERPLALGRTRAHDYEALPSPRIFKSHLPHAWLPRGARYIYVQRDGRDVALSYYQFYRSHLGYVGDFRAFFERFLAGDLQYGSWFKHVAGWQSHADDPRVLMVQYEHMQRNLPCELRRIAAFCGMHLDVSTQELVCTRCSFHYMRENESKFDHASAEPAMRGSTPGTFIRCGTSGEHAHALDPVQRQRFVHQLVQPSLSAGLELNLPVFLH